MERGERRRLEKAGVGGHVDRRNHENGDDSLRMRVGGGGGIHSHENHVFLRLLLLLLPLLRLRSLQRLMLPPVYLEEYRSFWARQYTF